MKVQIHANYDNETHKFTLQIGYGNQSFKWLALATAQCLTMGAPHGRRRCREKDFVVPQSYQIMPSDIYTNQCPFYHPDEVLNKHLNDNQEVFVDLVHRQPVDEYGCPIISKWAFIAFKLSEEHREERERLIEEKMGELEGVRRRREQEALQRRLQKERPHIAQMRVIMKEQLFNEEAIKETMNSEWVLISASGILDDIIPDADERDRIRLFFTENYSELSDMYKYFSAVNSGGGTHTLEYIEFNKFLCETNIFQGEDHSNELLKLFLESHIISEKETISAANIHSEIHLFEFFLCLIKIAIFKYITLVKKKVALLKKKGHQVSIAKASTPSPYEAVKTLYVEFLKPYIDTKPEAAALKASLGSDEVLLLLYENLDELSHAFHLYSNDRNKHEEEQDQKSEQPNISGMMNIKQFGNFVNDAEFLGDIITSERKNKGSEHDHLTVKDVRQIFSASQHDSVSNPEEIKLVEDGGERDVHQEQMVFSEFLEAISRFGALKWPDPSLTYLEKIRFAVKKTCSVSKQKKLN